MSSNLSGQFDGVTWHQPSFDGIGAPSARPVSNEVSEQAADVARRAATGPIIRMHSRTIPRIMADGNYKTLHHTGTSSGSTSVDYRRQTEDHFGWQHPVYGTLRGESGTGHYGDVEVEIDPKYRATTTLTEGDSLNDFRRDRSLTAIPISEVSGSAQPDSVLHRGGNPREGEYMEAQIDTPHGMIPTSAFTRATLPGRQGTHDDPFLNADREAAAHDLHRAGVKVFRSSDTFQYELPGIEGAGEEGDYLHHELRYRPGESILLGSLVTPTVANRAQASRGTVLESQDDYLRRVNRGRR